MLIIGSHVSFSGGLLAATSEAISYQANTFMFYTGAPTNTYRSVIDMENVSLASKLMLNNQIDINNVIAHAPYIINLANKEDLNKWQFSISFLLSELTRCNALGVSKLVIHPGNYLKTEKDEAIKVLSDALNMIISKTEKITILIETMSGKGSELCSTIDEIANVIQLVVDKRRIGVCVDTCHISDAGYDLNEFDKYLNEFEDKIGLSYLKCIHLNDSKNVVGSHKDRHANIGCGTIGFDNLIKIAYHPLLENVPKILETPYINEKPPYKEEIEMIRNNH